MKSIYVAPLAAACLLASASAAPAKDVVKVSDFGCDAEDATRFVQAALDSGAKRVVFDAKGSPWIVKPVRLRNSRIIWYLLR